MASEQRGEEMGKKLQKRCMFCARVFESEAGLELTDEMPKPKSICPLCEARIKKEAGELMKDPKPM